MLLEDLVDLAPIWAETGRTVPASRWATEVVVAVARKRNAAAF